MSKETGTRPRRSSTEAELVRLVRERGRRPMAVATEFDEAAAGGRSPAPIYGPGSSHGHGGIILVIAMGLVPAIPADTKNYITTSANVEDVAGFAIFAADRAAALGEDYDVVDNSIISYHEFLHCIALLCGRSMWDVPWLELRTLRPLMMAAARGWTWLEHSLGIPRVRVLEIQSTTYVSSSYWLSNRKSQAAGYAYRYPDVREGLKDTVQWYREAGWLTDPARTLAGPR